LKQVRISAGLQTANARLMMAVEYFLKSFSITAGSSYHQQLGISPSLMIVAAFKNK
jgi:hypothetical protein